ncbi:RNA 2',3'-cyclic phosphodiesterase [Streptomyces tagetis]|uniref:RNA 2',3'-cyclic phosphodiesterase n=1 Tax=Streptomyces tagetis TaxID=2820809 RepID=A0A940XTG0_9ACTN|nr:RNA 2',3'-cyclic phosphodiesterase [Streptomyces sp. RG38]MBQ0829313.1 RNA 2',3'-cyclic phosphodiesterase [Streptomyces sp. RG38]
MRLFAAVLPSEGALRALAAEEAALRALPGANALRWTDRPSWHLTLAFYGEADEDTAGRLTERLDRAAHRTAPFALALGGGGHFGRGRTLWTGVRGDVRALRLLAGRAEAAGRRAGLPPGEHRPYRAHLTLARAPGPYDVGPYTEALAGFDGPAWTVTELVLMRSELPRSGVPGERPRYETVARSALGDAG